jgi:pilus assembly protein CpaB
VRIDRRFLLALAASLVWGALVAGGFHALAGRAGRKAKAAGRDRQLVVAASALPVGANISRASVKLRAVPEAVFPKGGFERIEDVLERPVISAIQPDEPVIAARIAERGSGLGLAPLIPPGMRALAVRVNDVVGVAGFILPGMRVDVLVTGRPEGSAGSRTRTVLQNIAVLSAGQTVETDGKSQSISATVVTLLVNPAEAEALALGASEGRIQLVLRNSADAGIASTRGKQLGELFGSAAEPVAAPPAAPSKPTPEKPSREKSRPEPAIAAAPPVQPAAAIPSRSEQVLVIRGTVKTLEAAPKGGTE